MNKNMNEELSQSEMEELRQHLIVPMAVADILRHDLAIEPDMQYNLHLALSEVDPDSALLAIALCAQDLAAKAMGRVPMAAALHFESSNIIADYGSTWLHHYKTGPMPDTDFEKVLATVPEDLEALADLTDALCADLVDEHDVSESAAIIILGNLLSIQARAHMEIADYILGEIEFEREMEQSHKTGTKKPEREMIDLNAHIGNNIILFPGAAN